MARPVGLDLRCPVHLHRQRIQPCLPRSQDGTRPDLLATTGDFLRIWRLSDEPGSAQQGVRLEKLLNNVSLSNGLCGAQAACGPECRDQLSC